MKLEQISPSIWAVVDGSTYGNVGCIQLANNIVVIDTGMAPPIAKEFRNLISQKVGDPITDVILSHHHSDHVFGAQEFVDCNIIASSAMAAMYPELLADMWSPEGIKEMVTYYATNDPALSKKFTNLEIIAPTQTFKKTRILGSNKEINIQLTGGHTMGHSTVFFKPERVLFAADLIFCQQYPYAGDPTNNPQIWMEALEAILKMPLDVIIPGHGPLCDKEEVRKHLMYFKKLETWIRFQIQEEISLKEVLQRTDTSPTPPYSVKADWRLKSTIERWYNFYSCIF